jgi:hypothetical protein
MFAAISQEGTQYGIASIVWISLNRWESGNRPMAEYLTVKELSQYIKRSPRGDPKPGNEESYSLSRAWRSDSLQ